MGLVEKWTNHSIVKNPCSSVLLEAIKRLFSKIFTVGLTSVLPVSEFEAFEKS
ncbi:hypothetical protein BACCIP111895_01042 [Neobacillus rhizosphaerae]|uniref:Uncharacterized protein n=1 Tax=Neobacillus rhizosphaerae TaxID=2880965 RepID=A0ABN8KKB8_9BACI|nr:hypothetical protein [Neobacillus rhizosphaerae]CAH2713888.1 hypothetical protein BACCIP111895_01042 [Neobacillus rhizosphaerae]